MPSGTEFIKHEFDEAIAIQQSIIDSAKALSTSHPVADVKGQLTSDLKVDQQHLSQLQKFGKPYGATGKREEVAQGPRNARGRDSAEGWIGEERGL